MSFLDMAELHWGKMRVGERELLLNALKEEMDTDEVWDNEHVWVLANNPDFHSLPGSLCGHLMLALTKDGFSVEEFSRIFCALLGSADNLDRCVLCGDKTGYTKNDPVRVRSHYIEGTGQLCGDCHKKVYG